jgi:hypothetical protein
MNNRCLKSLGCVLVLASASLSLHAQKEREREPVKPCSCSAGEAECLFGYAAGCDVTCPDRDCECSGAWCFLGFPRPSKCKCTGPRGPEA